MATTEELMAEAQKRGLVTSTETLLEPKETTFGEFKKFAESTLKGIPSGVIDIVGGWGNLYDYLKSSGDPSAFSSTGIKQAISRLTGINLQQIPGYKGAYEFSQAGAPAALMTGLGVPGLFRKTPAGIAGEYGVAGTTGLFAQQVAPESPLAQLALQTTPLAVKGGLKTIGGMVTKPEGVFPSIYETEQLAQVGRLTPGELGLSRPQLASEAAIERLPESGQKPIQFRIAQAGDIESYLTNLFNKASGKTLTPAETTQAVVSSFNNYGKALSSKLRSDARVDFSAARSAGGLIDTTPIVDVIKSKLSDIPPEVKALDPVKNALQRIIDEYVTPEVPTQTIPSSILGPTGQPASVNIIPGTPASNIKINVDRLQKNLATWGDAVYSGKADFGKGNIFEGVAPGQAKGISIAVLNGFRQALDEAIANNVPGAEKLVKARDKFKENIARIEEFSDRPLTKAFDVKNVTDLVPEDVMTKLKSMPSSQRQFLIDVMQNNPNSQVAEVLNSIRRSKFDDVLSASQVKAGAVTDPTFNIKTALSELNKKGSEFADLFPNPDDLSQAKLALNWMSRTLASESPQVTGITGSQAYAFGGIAGQKAQLRFALQQITPILRGLVASPSDFADVIFNPNYRQAMIDLSTAKNFGDKAKNAIETLTKAGAIVGARGGAMMGMPESQLEDQSKPVSPMTDTTQDMTNMIEELKSRGYTVE